MRCNAEFYYVWKIPPIGIGRINGSGTYWALVAAATRGFTMALFTASRRNNFVGGTCVLLLLLPIFVFASNTKVDDKVLCRVHF